MTDYIGFVLTFWADHPIGFIMVFVGTFVAYKTGLLRLLAGSPMQPIRSLHPDNCVCTKCMEAHIKARREVYESDKRQREYAEFIQTTETHLAKEYGIHAPSITIAESQRKFKTYLHDRCGYHHTKRGMTCQQAGESHYSRS